MGAMNEMDQCVGFFSVKTHYGYTSDMVDCGVLPKYQHKGIGKALYSRAKEYFL